MEKFRFSARDQAIFAMDFEFMENVEEFKLAINAGYISMQEAIGLLGGYAKRKESAALGGSIEDIQGTIKDWRYARLNAEKKRLAREDGRPEDADKAHEEMVRNYILPDVLRHRSAGESKEYLLDQLRNGANLSPHSMDLIEAALNNFG